MNQPQMDNMDNFGIDGRGIKNDFFAFIIVRGM